MGLINKSNEFIKVCVNSRTVYCMCAHNTLFGIFHSVKRCTHTHGGRIVSQLDRHPWYQEQGH